MAVDKTLEIDLGKLTPESLKRLDTQLEKVIDQLGDTQSRSPLQSTAGDIASKTQKEEGLRKIFGKETFTNLVKVGSNPLAFVSSQVTKLIPGIGIALVATGIIAQFITKVNNFQAQFVDNVDERINIFRTKDEQARIQAGLTQLIITSSAGSTNPRDSFNSFRTFNEDQQRIENEFQLTNTGGVN